jgi:hypothetical protein
MWDALHSERVENSFLALAFIATANSLRAETAAWAGRMLLFGGERKGAAADEAKMDNYFELLGNAEAKRFAWMLALEALDRETGAACITVADTFANGHARETLEIAKGRDTGFAEELEFLRDAWGKLTRSISGAPKIG